MAISTPRHAVRKLPSFGTKHEEFEGPPTHLGQASWRMGKVRKTVEKVPLLHLSLDESESVSSTPRTRDARSPKVRKFTSPVNVRRLPVSNGENDMFC